MAKRDILKEAIADAKTVKETAIANAKAALEEAFTPRLKEMLATKLEEMDLEEEEEKLKEAPMKAEKTNKKGQADMRNDKKGSEEYRTERAKEKMEEDLDEEINLDEILAEIEEGEDKEEVKESDEPISEDEKTDTEDGMEDEEEDMEDEEIDLEDMSDDDLKKFIEDVIADMVASGDLEAGENFEEEDETEEVDVEISEDEEVNISETEIEEAKEEELDEAKKAKDDEDLKEAKAKEDDEKKKMEEELKEAYDTIETLKSDLNEVNLLNAKLLYTNKIFKAKNLTESQKVKVLGAFDKAGTVKESKLVFETLSEGLKAKKSPIKESLGSASRVSTNVNTKKPIIETDPMVARFQKLAGLK